jgi:hypothetical protein
LESFGKNRGAFCLVTVKIRKGLWVRVYGVRSGLAPSSTQCEDPGEPLHLADPYIARGQRGLNDSVSLKGSA